MATSNSNNVTKRINVGRRLTYGEMDENFEQLKLVITDVGNVELQIGDKVSTVVYDAKIADIDQSILDLENALIGTVSEEFVNQLEQRITVNENNILTLQGDVAALIDDTLTATDSTWSSSKINSEFGTRDTAINSNSSNISSLQTNKRDLTNTSFPRYDVSSTSTTETLDLSSTQVFRVDATTTARTLSFANEPGTDRAMTVVVHITGNSAVTWPAGIDWDSDAAPELGDNETKVVLFWDGIEWSGFVRVAK